MRWGLTGCLLITFVCGCTSMMKKKEPENPNLAKPVRQRSADFGDVSSDGYEDNFDEAAKASDRPIIKETDPLNSLRDPQALSIEKSLGVRY